jgi:hypothetical protein
VPNPPRGDDGSGPSATAPAMDEHGSARVELGVDGIERLAELLVARHPHVENREPHVARSDETAGVGRELVFLREIDKERDAGLEQLFERAARIVPGE